MQKVKLYILKFPFQVSNWLFLNFDFIRFHGMIKQNYMKITVVQSNHKYKNALFFKSLLAKRKQEAWLELTLGKGIVLNCFKI